MSGISRVNVLSWQLTTMTNDRGNEHEIDADDIFAGQMDYITSEIGA